MKDLRDYFERCFVITLAKRQDDRYKDFCARILPDWPFVQPERWQAVDGTLVPEPTWWTEGSGSWGCYCSHRQILEYCLNNNIKSMIVLEDDAVLRDGFSEKVTKFIKNVPDDWQMLYFGGQHLFVDAHPPIKVNDSVYVPYNLNRTHAMAFRTEGMKAVYRHLHAKEWTAKHHIDHHLGKFHETRETPIYCPEKWLVGQKGGLSNISNKVNKDLFWSSAVAASLKWNRPMSNTFVAVIGLHSSGTSATAGVLHHLGVHLGNDFHGYYGKNPDKSCSFEAVTLANICSKYAPFPSSCPINYSTAENSLAAWIKSKQVEAKRKQTLAAGKYPTLCAMGKMLETICGDNLIVVHCDRPFEKSLASILRRSDVVTRLNPDLVTDCMEWLQREKEAFLQTIPSERQITVQYDDLIEHTNREVDRLDEFLGLQATDAQIERACRYVNPKARHVV